MLKILNKFDLDKTEKNAKRLINHICKHPMSMLLATENDNKIIQQAKLIIKG